MEELLKQADLALHTWETSWSPFISAPLREEAISRMSVLSELSIEAHGGRPGAERQRLKYSRSDQFKTSEIEKIPIHGLNILGNFLFDKASPDEIRHSIELFGIEKGELGDIWMRGDRGAQALCSPEAAFRLHGQSSLVREVKITFEALEISKLRLPAQRSQKRITTIEASRRIDAIASAGFGLSRSKVVNQIKEGNLRLNWKQFKQSNQAIIEGDRLQLPNKGTLEIIKIEPTKRQRWKIEMLRS